jgi:bifunctional non-homologous end joining protein LigD
LSFGDFEGEIPEDEPGAGLVTIWDQGTYESLRSEDDHLEFTLFGGRLSGKFHLVRFHRGGEREWLIFKTNTPTK